MAGKLPLSPTYPQRDSAELEMDTLISAFYADVRAWKQKHAAGHATDTSVREAIWAAVCQQFGATLTRYTLVDPPGAVPAADPLGPVPGPLGPLGPPAAPPIPPPPQVAPPALAKLLALAWGFASRYASGRVIFAALFIVAATFYFKDKRLAETAPPPVPPAEIKKVEADPDEPPDGWEKMSEADLARLGFRRITRDEFEKLILPDTVVVPKGAPQAVGYRVAHTEDEYAFLEDLSNPKHYAALPFSALERKPVPKAMPAAKPEVLKTIPEPAPVPKAVEPKDPVVRPKPKG